MNPLDHAEAFVLLTAETLPDGLGGFSQAWTETLSFFCLLTLNSSAEIRSADKPDVQSKFKGMVDLSCPIKFHDVFRRVSDGTVFRVTSDPPEHHSPRKAGFQVKVFSAEKYELQGGTDIDGMGEAVLSILEHRYTV